MRKDRRSNDKKGSWDTLRIGHKNNNSNITEKHGEISHYEECKSQDSTQKATFINKNIHFTSGKSTFITLYSMFRTRKIRRKGT